MNYWKNALLVFGLAILWVACEPTSGEAKEEVSEAEEKLPNIIMLIGDDQGYPYFGFMGADYVHTPNMDSLAANGGL